MLDLPIELRSVQQGGGKAATQFTHKLVARLTIHKVGGSFPRAKQHYINKEVEI